MINFNLLRCSKAKKEAGLFSTYIVYNSQNKLYKIGKSKNVFRRVNQLRKDYNKDLSFIGFNSIDYEAEIHFEYRQYREFGEWFSICINEVLDIFLKYKFIDLKEKNI